MNLKIIISSIVFVLFTNNIFSQNEPIAYEIYNSKGKKVKFSNIVKESLKADVVFFGELHNNAIAHWLQLELVKAVYPEKKENLVLGAEMFEADDQIILNEYIEGFIDFKKFDAEAKLWKNYSTDYAPLVDFAKENKLKFIATNIPTRYANMVYKRGISVLDSVSDLAKLWMTPLPFEVDETLESYKNMKIPGHGNNLMLAQAIKDATMAHFIYNTKGENDLFIHFNGAYHSDLKEGIVWYLQNKNKELKIMNISTVEVENFNEIDKEYFNKADFIIVTNKNMTKTY